MKLGTKHPSMYNFVRSRQLEGTLELSGVMGVYPITSYRVRKGWGEPPEGAWPYNGKLEDWPPTEEPKSIDRLAKKQRIGVYQRVHSVAECKILLRRNIWVRPSILINRRQWADAKDGIIKAPQTIGNDVDVHSISLFKYNDVKSEFQFSNSWGTKWGDNGYGYLPYEYFERFMIESWMVVPFAFIPSRSMEKRTIITYAIINLLGGIIHVIELFDTKNDEFIGWSFVLNQGDFLEIEEFYIRPDYRHRAYGIKLAQEIMNLQNYLCLPLKMWISQADTDRDNFYVVEKILKRMKFSFRESKVSWAVYECYQ
jgi:Papain family cysteine protease